MGIWDGGGEVTLDFKKQQDGKRRGGLLLTRLAGWLLAGLHTLAGGE